MHNCLRQRVGWWQLLIGLVAVVGTSWAGAIETDVLQQPWPRQHVRHLEVGRAPVVWREYASKHEGIFAGVRFTAPLPQQQAWDLANDYHDLGAATPGIVAVKFLEQTSTRQVIQIDAKVLWKRVRLVFEVEQEPPGAIRFQLIHHTLGTYRGLARFEPVRGTKTAGLTDAAEGTAIECVTWLQPARPVPMGLVLLAERVMLLRGVKSFLAQCEAQRGRVARSAQAATSSASAASLTP